MCVQSLNNRLYFVDVGGAKGVHPKWDPYRDHIFPVLIEPNPKEAAMLQQTLTDKFGCGLVIDHGLSNVTEDAFLNVTQFWGCTSLRIPNSKFLERYRISDHFAIEDTIAVSLTRYDSLVSHKKAPAPDAIKVDVQGYEYEVLLGFGGLLETCIGIELEAHMYPIYEGQKLLGDITSFLDSFGFVLRRLSFVPNFDGDAIEADAWFTKSIDHWSKMNEADRRKFSIFCEVNGLIDYNRITPNAPPQHIAEKIPLSFL